MNPNAAKTIDQAVSEWKAGNLIALVEYRSSKAEPITWSDRETGRAMKAVTLTHVVENDKTSMIVSERVPETFDYANYVPPFKKGEKVLVQITSVARAKGVTTLYGTLEPLDINGTSLIGKAAK